MSDYLKTKNELEAVGGSAYLAALADFTPTAVNVLHYARIVKEYSQRCSLFKLFRDGIERVEREDPLILASEVTSIQNYCGLIPSGHMFPPSPI